MIRKLFQVSGAVYIAAILAVYYYLGAINFPDFQNYVSIAENGGWMITENEYFFEWVSRGLLSAAPVLGIAPTAAVDLLALINQAICCMFFFYLLQHEDKRRNFGGMLLLAWLGFLFFTTTLRAAPAYLAISLFVLREAKCDLQGFCILLFGLAWHDSFAIPAAIAVASSISASIPTLERFSERIHLNRCIVYGSAALLLLSEPLRDNALSLVNIDIGLREAYLDSDESGQGFGKLIYCALALLMCHQLTGKNSEFGPRIQRIAALLALAIACAYIANGVAAVRIAMFAFCAFVPVRGFFIFNFERHTYIRCLQLIGAPLILAFNMLDVLQRTI